MSASRLPLTAVSPIWVKGMSPAYPSAGLIPFSLIFKAEAVGRNVDAVFLTVKFCDYSEMLSVR